MKVIAKNSKFGSSLNGVVTRSRDGIKFCFRAVFYDESRYEGNLYYDSLSELIDYLVDECGCDILTFKKI